MKLVEYDEPNITRDPPIVSITSDSEYIKPKTLSNLDTIMTQILQRSDIVDTEKWRLYNQVL